jgi:Fe-S-cluster containining protein
MCCEQQGFVYLTRDDIVRASNFLGMTRAQFEKKYVFRSRHEVRLRVPRHATCHFLRDGGCSIHEAKPLQCSAFPFWPELVDSRREWLKTGAMCPGIGKGPLIQIEKARAIAEELR